MITQIHLIHVLYNKLEYASVSRLQENKLEVANLKAFIAVAEHASFSLAAKQLFLTQPAVSKRIATLEEQLNTRLFDRVSSQVTLTEAGSTLLISARRILLEIEHAINEVKSLDDEIGGRLKVGTSHHVGIHRLPPILRAFNANYPGVELDLSFLDSELACEQVQDAQLELAVVTLPQIVPDNLLTEIIWPDPLSIIVPNDHALASAEIHSPEELSSHPAILPAVGTIPRRILQSSLEPFDVNVHVALESNYLETIKMMVSVGLGWSVLPSNMQNEEIVAVNMPELSMHRMLGTVCLKNRTLSRAALRFIETLAVSKQTAPNPS